MVVGGTFAMIAFRLAAAVAGLTALFVAGLGVGPHQPSPVARVVAALSRLHFAAPSPAVAPPRAVAAQTPLDLAPTGGIVRAAPP